MAQHVLGVYVNGSLLLLVLVDPLQFVVGIFGDNFEVLPDVLGS
jgi:hypothetical protein